MPAIKVVIVEDDKEIRNLMEFLLSEAPDIEVVRSFSTGDNFLKAFDSFTCDVVLMDINMPGKSGLECVAEAKPKKPEVQYLMSTMFENAAYIFQALCSGATGYLVKNNTGDRIIEAVRDIYQGGSPMSSQIARMVVNSLGAKQMNVIHSDQLTTREKEILDLLAKGLMYKEIASQKDISTETVRKHVRNIYEKLQVTTRMEAIDKVYPKGL
jgi:DNA-binding NarL/FixJ family response regulator